MDETKWKSKYVTLGWEGNDMEAFCIPLNVAYSFLITMFKVNELGIKRNDVFSQMILSDVLDNYENGEETYILGPQVKDILEEVNDCEKILKKHIV